MSRFSMSCPSGIRFGKVSDPLIRVAQLLHCQCHRSCLRYKKAAQESPTRPIIDRFLDPGK